MNYYLYVDDIREDDSFYRKLPLQYQYPVIITRDYNEDLSEQLFNEDAKRKGVNR